MKVKPAPFAALGLAFLLDHFNQLVVHGDRIGAEHDLLGIKAEARIVAEGALVPDAVQAVHDIQHYAGTNRLGGGQRPDERVRIGLGETVRAVHVGKMAIRDVLLFSEATLMRRFTVKPGITGLWQVSGRSTLGFAKWIEMDFDYIDSWSLGLDFRILAKTVGAVIKGTGAI